MRAITAVALAAAIGVAGAQARPASDERIRHGIGIGKVRLGMTDAQVLAAMGRPDVVLRVAGGFGRRGLELQYGVDAYLVRLESTRGAMRVVAVSTTLRRERTTEGLGVGSLERDLARAYGRRLECARLRTAPFPGSKSERYVTPETRDCVLDTAGGTQTVFSSAVQKVQPWERLEPEDWGPRARVYAVAVRA